MGSVARARETDVHISATDIHVMIRWYTDLSWVVDLNIIDRIMKDDKQDKEPVTIPVIITDFS